MSKERLTFPMPETMTPEQRRAYDAIISGPRKTLVGPLRAVLLSPSLAEKWSALGEELRFGTSLPKRLKELAIIMVARRWTSQVEWWVHANAALEAGVEAATIAAIEQAQPPDLRADEWEVYEFTRQLQERGAVETTLYRALQQRWGDVGVVELAAVVGYYTMVSLTLNAHEIAPPQDVQPPLNLACGLINLPPAHMRGEVG